MHVPASPGVLRTSSVARMGVHAVVVAMLSAALLLILDLAFRQPTASLLYTLGAPGVAGLVALNYFHRRDTEEPLLAAIAFTAVTGLVDLALVQVLDGRLALVDPAFGFGFPLLLSFGATGLAGELAPRVFGERMA